MQVQLFFCFFYIVLVTVMVGAAFSCSRGITDLVLRGFVFQLALFSMCYYIAILIMHIKSMNVLAGMYLAIISLVGLLGAFRLVRCRRQVQTMLLEQSMLFSKNRAFVLAPIIVIVYQILRVVICEPFSISDSCEYYGLITGMVEKSEIYPLGFSAKYITTTWYPYEAFLARLTGCHGVVIASTVLPFFLVLLSYCALWRLGKTIFNGDVRKNCLFILATGLISEMMLVLADSAAYMLVWPTWGKNIPPSIICPLLFALFLEQANRVHIDAKTLIWMFLLSFVAATTTAASMIAIPIQMFALALIYFFREKRIDLCLMCVVVIVPELFQFIIYVFFSRGMLTL
ncbi:MAG: hypothetical protein E7278_02125 [Lachnospiraceae bacterium]|nr:hypothetical protein [Lachnospiraceae bacterium]